MSHLPCYTIRIKNMRNKMKTFRVETEDRYGLFNSYDIQAETLELATLIAKKANHYIFDIEEVGSSNAPSHKPEQILEVAYGREYYHGKEVVRDSDGSAVVGWYDDNDGNDIRCRD